MTVLPLTLSGFYVYNKATKEAVDKLGKEADKLALDKLAEAREGRDQLAKALMKPIKRRQYLSPRWVDKHVFRPKLMGLVEDLEAINLNVEAGTILAAPSFYHELMKVRRTLLDRKSEVSLPDDELEETAKETSKKSTKR